MDILLVNLGKAVPQKMGGRDYLVAPLTLIVPGVLSGSQGPILYPEDEVERWPGLWNHVPLVVYHPVENGQHVTARDPDILDKSGVGLVLRDSYADNRRSAEAWFDVENTKRVDRTLAPAQRIYPRLLSGKPIEISTGLDLDQEPAPEGATHNGQSYKSIARNFRPDHLAILPDAKGACSNKDGCGVNVNEEKTEEVIASLQCLSLAEECCALTTNAWSDAAREAAAAAKKASAAAHIGTVKVAMAKASGYSGEKASAKATSLHEAAAKSHEKAISEHLKSAKESGDLKDTRPSSPWSVAYSKHSNAKEMHEKLSEHHRVNNDSQEDEDFRECQVECDDDPDCINDCLEELDLLNTANVGFDSYLKTKTTNLKGEQMKRNEMIQYLTTNCECWKGKDDKALLEKMDDPKLAKLVGNAKVILVVNQIKNKKANANDGSEAVAGVPWTELATLLGVDLNPADDPIAFAAALKAKVDEISTKLGGSPAPAEPGMDDTGVAMASTDDEDQVAATAGTQEVDKVGNKRRKALTEADWLSSAPPAIRSAVTNAMAIEKQTKAKLVQRLVGNIANGPKRQAMGAKMMAKSLGELQDLASLIPEAPQGQQVETPNFAFAGGAGAGSGTDLVDNSTQDDSDNLLPVFTVNFEEQASPKLRQKVGA